MYKIFSLVIKLYYCKALKTQVPGASWFACVLGTVQTGEKSLTAHFVRHCRKRNQGGYL